MFVCCRRIVDEAIEIATISATADADRARRRHVDRVRVRRVERVDAPIARVRAQRRRRGDAPTTTGTRQSTRRRRRRGVARRVARRALAAHQPSRPNAEATVTRSLDRVVAPDRDRDRASDATTRTRRRKQRHRLAGLSTERPRRPRATVTRSTTTPRTTWTHSRAAWTASRLARAATRMVLVRSTQPTQMHIYIEWHERTHLNLT